MTRSAARTLCKGVKRERQNWNEADKGKRREEEQPHIAALEHASRDDRTSVLLTHADMRRRRWPRWVFWVFLSRRARPLPLGEIDNPFGRGEVGLSHRRLRGWTACPCSTAQALGCHRDLEGEVETREAERTTWTSAGSRSGLKHRRPAITGLGICKARAGAWLKSQIRRWQRPRLFDVHRC